MLWTSWNHEFKLAESDSRPEGEQSWLYLQLFVWSFFLVGVVTQLTPLSHDDTPRLTSSTATENANRSASDTEIESESTVPWTDIVHCRVAPIYIFYHFPAAEWVFGVSLIEDPWMVLFTITMSICGLCQLIRVKYPAPKQVVQVVNEQGIAANRTVITSNKRFLLELMFMATEHTVFMFWLYGMIGGAAMRH